MAAADFACDRSNTFCREAMLMFMNWKKVLLSINFVLLSMVIEQTSGQ